MAGVSIGDVTRPPEECWAPPVPDKPRRPEVAVSLRQLISTGSAVPINMTRIDGYVLDDTGDVILYGRRMEKGQEEVMLDDLIVAIRSVYGLYGTHPHVSIDLDPWSNARYWEVRNNPKRTREEYLAACEDMRNISSTGGLPKSARVPRILLIADYKMKLVAMGKEILKIKDPFPSRMTNYIEARKEALRTGKSFDYGPPKPGRFFFEPAKMTYLQDGKTGRNTFFDCVQVVLRSELKTQEGDALVGETNRFAQKFACDWTNRMDEVNRSDVLWRDMGNIFRHFAFARVMLDKGALQKIDKDVLLDGYQITNVPMPVEFKGTTFTYEWSYNGKTYKEIWCYGAVELSGTVTPSTDHTAIADVRRAGEIALASRRSCTDACWNIE
jgi:hypothetical protein